MAKKTGVAVQLGNRKWRFSEEAGAPMATEQRATLVISDEPVYTRSEVNEILRRVDKAYLGFDAPTMHAFAAEGFSIDTDQPADTP